MFWRDPFNRFLLHPDAPIATPPAAPAAPETTPAPGAGPDDDDLGKILRDILTELGVTVPTDLTDDALVEKIKAAFGAGYGGNTPPSPLPNPATVKQEPHAVMMSLSDLKNKDPLTVALAQGRARDSRNSRIARIDSLVKRGMPQPQADEMKRSLEAIQFSIMPTGDMVHQIDETLRVLEMSLPKIDLTRQVHPVQQPHPSDMGNGLSMERVQEIANQQAKASGLPMKK